MTEMPVLDGAAAAALIRQKERGTDRRTPIVGLSGEHLTAERERLLNAGMDDVLMKPLSPTKVRTLLERIGRSSGDKPDV